MSENDVRALVEYRIEQAEEALRDGSVLLKQGGCRTVVNRAYYAMFYAVLALLCTRGKGTSKHSGAISLFDIEFVKPGTLGKDLSRWLHEAFEARQKADYEEFVSVAPEDAATLLGHAEAFVARARQLVQQGR